jgi:hypothetical protein
MVAQTAKASLPEGNGKPQHGITKPKRRCTSEPRLQHLVEQLAEQFGKVAFEERTLTWQNAQWKEWKAMRYRFHFSDLEIEADEAEASDCDFVFRDGLGNRWGQKPTGPSRKRTL